MDILKLLSHFEGFDPEVYDRFNTRRKAMRQFAGIGKKLTMASLPLAASAMIQKAYGQTATGNVASALQLALKAEYLEAHFYVTGINASQALGLQGDTLDKLKRIGYDELLHVEAVRATLATIERPQVPYVGPAANKPAGADYGIDITGGGGNGNGPMAPALSNLDVFLAAAQAFEDNGVRAYKGQATNVMPNKAVLAAALGIHSVEARHAAALREIRARRAGVQSGFMPKPWPTGADPGNIPEPFNAKVAPLYGPGIGNPNAYPSESNTMQAGINIAQLGVTNAQATESFDEPQEGDTVVRYLTGQVLPDIKFIY